MQWFTQAPANIALIKYMGKKDTESNLPANPSLSYTLDNLVSSVVLESYMGKKDLWEPLEIPGAATFELSSSGQQRFLRHLTRIKDYFRYTGSFIVRSTNNFPHSSGLASSASSFAALTKCASLAISELTSQPLPSIEEQAKLSMRGSGSSCRSFFSPWALWQEDKVESIPLAYTQLYHQVIVISHTEKQVSSSEAHQRVKTSNQYAARAHRATENLKVLLDAFRTKDWASAYQICWREFHDMHNLFNSSVPPFHYMTEKSKEVLNTLKDLWHRAGDGPIVTMDAGPNIHLLYRMDQVEQALQFKQDYLVGNYDVL
ncbi:diphosphomevalonate/mevalonate 3,5-bisphosphate decarboxylase family protein [Legionella fairfieldensis]|uniref:diphosphomevalonate/mevalonate 3,5-bisphosphate decarboxylase family protein n=1 Tax=Legionella fairfieldensis TaxID=45064 RepID=UPI00048C6DA7|nr:diphosphomevalonate decarboxylase [Legionella fairfieldensis]